jgi:Zn-dependent protease
LLVRRYGYQVMSIDLTGFGGMCRWAGRPTLHERGVIAWGGVAAQAVLLAVTLAVLAVVGWPTSVLGASLAYAFTRTNATIIVLNLLPMPPFDGAEAWSLVWRTIQRLRNGDRFNMHKG